MYRILAQDRDPLFALHLGRCEEVELAVQLAVPAVELDAVASSRAVELLVGADEAAAGRHRPASAGTKPPGRGAVAGQRVWQRAREGADCEREIGLAFPVMDSLL